ITGWMDFPAGKSIQPVIDLSGFIAAGSFQLFSTLPTVFPSNSLQLSLGIQPAPAVVWWQKWGYMEAKFPIRLASLSYQYQRIENPSIPLQQQASNTISLELINFLEASRFLAVEVGVGFFL
ncbi:MAG: hypothetical protein AAFQ98_25045, partial [Bacteroidota bacterium]